MPLLEGQAQVRDLVIGPGTDFNLRNTFDPFSSDVRSDQSGKRAWNHGNWSGVEWLSERIIPMHIDISGTSQADVISNRHLLADAFRPIGEEVTDVELRFVTGGVEYVLFGRPRQVQVDATVLGVFKMFTQSAFVALDPMIYAGTETSVANIGLPTFTGGLTVPFTVPFTIDAVAADGFASLTNDGTADTGLTIRLDGPVESPTVTLVRDDGTFQQLTFDLTLTAGQWLDIDTKARTVLLNGSTSRRGQTSGQWPILPPGTHELRWRSPNYNATAQMSVTFRSAWW